ncbi:MAG: DUF6056 family protein [Eubacteriales bacterium]
MYQLSEKSKRNIFIAMVAIVYGMIFIYNCLTPNMSDDLTYGIMVREADSIWDLFLQEYNQYMTWNGRSISHIMLRFFLTGNKMIFNVCNAAVFTLLSLFIYWNIEFKKKYDHWIYIVIILFLFGATISFGETILWETGACNYLWGSYHIMLFITVFRYFLKKNSENNSLSVENEGASVQTISCFGVKSKKQQILTGVLLFFTGILAGWANENTSGGGICIMLMYLFVHCYMEKNKIKGWMISGMAGAVLGLGIMVFAPGNEYRASFRTEIHTGILAMMSRFLKCTLKLRERFSELIILFVLIMVILFVYKKIKEKALHAAIFFIAFIATSYALIATTEPVERAYFGAGIFLIIAVVQAIATLGYESRQMQVIRLFTGIIGVLWLGVLYIDDGANLARIYREFGERVTYIEEQKAEGIEDVLIPLLRPQFENDYTFAYDSDIEEDSEYWINQFYKNYYEVNSVSGISRDEWNEMYE